MEQKDQKIGKYEEDGSEQVIGALHRALGPGLLESACEACFCHKLRLRGLTFERQRSVGITYKGLIIDCGYRVDVLVEGRIVVELKAIERLLALHPAQILTYVKLLAVRIGLLVNFNVTSLRQGLRCLSLPPPSTFLDLPDLFVSLPLPASEACCALHPYHSVESRYQAAMMMRWQLLQIADSAFPTGGFAHSGGLEAAAAHGRARTAEDLGTYVAEHLWNVGWASLPFVTATFDAPGEVWALDAWIDAAITSHVANRASRTQGRTFLATCARIFDEPPLAAMATRAGTRDVSAHLAPVFGASLAALGATRQEAQALYLYVALRGVVGAAVRLGLAGPHQAQRLLRSHGGTLDAVLAACASVTPDEAATASPLLDVMGATHDRLYARLFQS